MLKKLTPAVASLLVLLPSSNVQAHSFTDVIENAEKSVCLIESAPRDIKTSQPTEKQDNPFGGFFKENQQELSGFGSCFILKLGNKKYIITNHHVIENSNNYTTFNIFFHEDLKRYKAKIVGSDEVSDIAVLEMSNREGRKKLKQIAPLEIGNSDALKKGNEVFAIGHPIGQTWTVTQGIVSATKKRSSNTWQEVVQTDVSINQGNSGGPLFNQMGEVVGINSFIMSPEGGSIGISFSVTSNSAMYIIKNLVEHGKIVRGRLGIAFTVDDEIGKIVIQEIQNGGPVGKTGKYKIDDILLKINGKDIEFPADIGLAMDKVKPNQKVELVVLRGTKIITETVTTDIFIFD